MNNTSNTDPNNNIWQFQNMLSRRLRAWAVISIVIGAFLRIGGAFWKGVGGQFIGWGLVNLGIATFGAASAQQRADQYANPAQKPIMVKESNNLRRLLWINAGLDVLYMLGGRMLARRDEGEGNRQGAGLGIVLQGLFLLVFDIVHARQAPKHDD